MSAHDWAGNEHHCLVCSASYHCPKCNDGCSMMGHLHDDAEGSFYHCQEPERWERLKVSWGWVKP